MTIGQVILGGYGVVVVAAMALTLREQLRTRNKTIRHALLSYALCLIWPLIFVAGLVLSRRGGGQQTSD